MDNLDHLILNNNELKHLKAGMFEGLPSLTTLYIDHNQIVTINKDTFSGLEGSSSLNFCASVNDCSTFHSFFGISYPEPQ